MEAEAAGSDGAVLAPATVNFSYLAASMVPSSPVTVASAEPIIRPPTQPPQFGCSN